MDKTHENDTPYAVDAGQAGPTDDWLVRHIAEAGSAESVVPLLERRIREGAIPPGTRLPTIRTLSERTGVSFRNIRDAVAVLRGKGLVETRRRGGTVVADPRAARPAPAAEPAAPTDPVNTAGELAQASSDPGLLPDLTDALAAGLRTPQLHSNVRQYITDRLRTVAQRDWPFEAEAYIAGGSGAEAALLCVGTLAAPSGKLAVDVPANPGLLDHIRRLGLEVFQVPADEEGADPDALAAALRQGARTYLFQPTGPYAMTPPATPARVRQLADVIAAFDDVLVVEDDAVGPLANVAGPTFGTVLPGQAVRVRSYCRSYGADLRTSVIGGPRAAVERIRDNRSYGLAVNSRILQEALAHLIESPATARRLKRARGVYAGRKAALADALLRRGIPSRSGPNAQFLWVEVNNEADTLIDLATAGYSVGAGSRSFVEPPATGHLRIATLRLPDDTAATDRLADAIGRAMHGQMRDLYA
ncbi:aminotransferase class I/II-fold pyridoxal phosphate-dependent enzyme [Streptomyces abyssomicinicus]|uniref:aminotransferase class I/II-fold pyridoxal phosphate-dependent enzyme n=1 Tax=Streptomyces abyssomicinicus TaxID=574929 RepID=UPI0012508B11|nr:aminotransferase class I/II-fold pyridoxal phosphate-dependent enzyme [Streptomyces abyssomicinicus]